MLYMVVLNDRERKYLERMIPTIHRQIWIEERDQIEKFQVSSQWIGEFKKWLDNPQLVGECIKDDVGVITNPNAKHYHKVLQPIITQEIMPESLTFKHIRDAYMDVLQELEHQQEYSEDLSGVTEEFTNWIKNRRDNDCLVCNDKFDYIQHRIGAQAIDKDRIINLAREVHSLTDMQFNNFKEIIEKREITKFEIMCTIKMSVIELNDAEFSRFSAAVEMPEISEAGSFAIVKRFAKLLDETQFKKFMEEIKICRITNPSDIDNIGMTIYSNRAQVEPCDRVQRSSWVKGLSKPEEVYCCVLS